MVHVEGGLIDQLFPRCLIAVFGMKGGGTNLEKCATHAVMAACRLVDLAKTADEKQEMKLVAMWKDMLASGKSPRVPPLTVHTPSFQRSQARAVRVCGTPTRCTTPSLTVLRLLGNMSPGSNIHDERTQAAARRDLKNVCARSMCDFAAQARHQRT